MHHEQIFFRQFPLQLTNCLDIRKTFNVTNCSADLGNNDIIIPCLTKFSHSAFDLIGNMRDHLYRFAQVSSFSFFCDDCLINTAGCYIVSLGSVDIQKTFTVANVKICFGAIFRHIAFPVLVRIKCSRININVGIEFLNSNP